MPMFDNKKFKGHFPYDTFIEEVYIHAFKQNDINLYGTTQNNKTKTNYPWS